MFLCHDSSSIAAGTVRPPVGEGQRLARSVYLLVKRRIRTSSIRRPKSVVLDSRIALCGPLLEVWVLLAPVSTECGPRCAGVGQTEVKIRYGLRDQRGIRTGAGGR